MTFRLNPGETIEESVKRVIEEQIIDGLRELNNDDLDQAEQVHQVRKRLKKIRALLRLVRDATDAYSEQNEHFRDAGRLVSAARDATAHLETLEMLGERYEDALPEALIDAARAGLEARRASLRGEQDVPARLDQIEEALVEGRRRLGSWQLDSDGFDAIAGGIERVYARGREALQAVEVEPDTDGYHEWRKRAKYLRYQLKLLRPLWPGPVNALRAELHTLTDLLGDDHDLALLVQVLQDDPDAYGGERSVQVLVGAAQQARRVLQRRAHPLGTRIWWEEPEEFVERVAGWWEGWES